MNAEERATEGLLTFIGASPTPFHAVEAAALALRAAGFVELREADAWSLARDGRYLVTRNGSTLGAFIVGNEPAAGHHWIGAHTDSPNLRLKPLPEITRHGYRQLGVEVYGGALLSSWADRDLGLAGRVLVDRGGAREARLVRFDRAIGRVPLLAIHLDREVNEKGLSLNKEAQLVPVIGLEGGAGFFEWMGGELGVAPGAIAAHELMFYDLVPPTVAGLSGEFIHAARLDNQASCHAALSALLTAADQATEVTRGVVLYDNEEIGSATSQGAGGPFLGDLVERIGASLGVSVEDAHRSRARSMLISADMAHAIHPNYADRHEPHHQPRLNGGPVIKFNANARYATDAESAAVFARLASDADVTVQRFVMRADLPCGSTIGPIVATRLGWKTVDVGNPMLSMHSCREMGGSRDHHKMVRALERFFQARQSFFA
ncbi:MAG: M18 family aminopeptidase [Candidatus Eisenbacteria bacterium]